MSKSKLGRKILPSVAFFLLTVAAAGSLFAQRGSADAGLDIARMDSFMEMQAARLKQEAHARIDTREKLESERESLLREFRFMIGLDPLPERTPLELNIARTVDCGRYTIEVMHYMSLPGFYVTANLYRPKQGRGPFPATIWGPGHGSGEFGTKTSRQQHASEWVLNGYICMVIDPIQAAEVYGIHHGLAGYELREWYSRGYTPMAIEVWNTMRAVDYLFTRPDVDGNRITLTGVSGGGHLSWMAGAADPRIAVVQPAAGTADVYTHITRDLQRMHCDCAYFVNTYRHDWPTLAGLIAPRPLLMHNSIDDAYYPPEGYKYVLERAKEIFGWYGIAGKTDMCEVEGPHGYYPFQRERAVEFSNRMFSGRTKKIESRPVQAVPADQLGAMGGIYADHPRNINARVYEVLTPTAEIGRYDTRQAWEVRRESLLGDIRRIVLRNLPDRIAPRKIAGERDGEYLLETEDGIRVPMMSDMPDRADSDGSAVLYVASPGDTWSNSIWSFMKPFPLRDRVTSKHMVYPRGIGVGSWDAVRLQRYERGAMTLGRTLDDMRLADILHAIELVASDPSFKPGAELSLVGMGPQAVLAAYAAILDERVTRVVLHSPTVSHVDGPHFLNVLRFTDIPEALALLAPRCEVVFLTREIGQFSFTGEIFGLYGAGDKLRRCVSVTQALNLPGTDSRIGR